MQLSARLQEIASLVTPGNRLVDVGCDHGFLPVSLVLEGKIPSAVASDVGRGPLSRAKEHIRAYGLEDKIETCLSDGLLGLSPSVGDTLVIAGMGGGLMQRILQEGKAVRDTFRELVLSPQSEIPGTRAYLLEEGYEIAEERMLREDGKFYVILKAVPARKKQEVWSTEELCFGRQLLRERHPVLRDYLQREREILSGIEERLQGKEGEAIRKRREEIREERRLVEVAINYYDNQGPDTGAESPVSGENGGGMG